MLFELNCIGYNYIEDTHNTINRPNGSGNYLFLFFSTPVHMLFEDQTLTTYPSAIVLYEPDFPQHYGNTESGFTNDWFHIEAGPFDDFIKTLGIPFNQPFYLDQDPYIREFIRNLENEYKMKERFWQENVHALLTGFFIRLARQYHHIGHLSIDPYMAQLKEQLRGIRSMVLTGYQHPWSVDEMADLAKLSRSRFCVLYKLFFQISPKEDLLTERFSMAKHLLLTTQLSVQEVASKVGYENMYHFNKQFKKIVGTPPGRFRR